MANKAASEYIRTVSANADPSLRLLFSSLRSNYDKKYLLLDFSFCPFLLFFPTCLLSCLRFLVLLVCCCLVCTWMHGFPLVVVCLLFACFLGKFWFVVVSFYRLWHQLTADLEILISKPQFSQSGNTELLQLYENFITVFESKLNQLRLGKMVIAISAQIPGWSSSLW